MQVFETFGEVNRYMKSSMKCSLDCSYCTVTEKLQKYTDLREELIRYMTTNTAYIIPIILHTMGIIPNKLHRRWKLLNLCPAPNILMQRTVTLNTCHTVKEVLAEQWMRSAWSVRPVLLQELNQHKSYIYKFTDTTQSHKTMMMMMMMMM